jgi:hypothetical protein
VEFSVSDVANTALLLRDTKAGGIAVVEGPADSRFLSRLIRPEAATVVASGKPYVGPAIARIRQLGYSGFLGIVDADFDGLEGRSQPPGVLAWDFHDLEVMGICSAAFEAVVHHFCVAAKVQRFLGTSGHNTVCEALLERAAPLGALRLVSERGQHKFSFDKVRLRRFIDARTLTVNIDGVIGSCLQRSCASQQGLAEIRSRVDDTLGQGLDVRHLVRGHDVTTLFSAGLRRALASLGQKAPTAEVIEAALLATYSADDFKQTAIYGAIQAWEDANNRRYPFLRG